MWVQNPRDWINPSCFHIKFTELRELHNFLALLSALADGTCPMAMLIEIGLWLCSSELFSLQAVHSLQSASWPHFTCRQTTDFRKKLSQTRKHM